MTQLRVVFPRERALSGPTPDRQRRMPAVAAGASLAVGAEEQGSVSGLVSACPAAGFVLGPISGGFLYQYYQPAAGWGAVLILLIVFAMTLRPRKDPVLSQT